MTAAVLTEWSAASPSTLAAGASFAAELSNSNELYVGGLPNSCSNNNKSKTRFFRQFLSDFSQ